DQGHAAARLQGPAQHQVRPGRPQQGGLPSRHRAQRRRRRPGGAQRRDAPLAGLQRDPDGPLAPARRPRARRRAAPRQPPAQALMRERQRLSDQVERVRRLERDLSDAVEFAELADAEGDEASLQDARAQLALLRELTARAELEALLSGEADANDAYLEINSG